MDDLTAVQEFRSGAPEADRARLAPGRRRLLDTAGARQRGSAFRHDWRFAVVGAATAVALAAVVGVRIADDSGWGTADRSAVAPADPAGRIGAATVLNRAADTAAKAPAPHPGNGQWVYTQSLQASRYEGVLGKPQKREDWRMYRDVQLDNDLTMGNPSPLRMYELLGSLSADRQQAIRQVSAFYAQRSPAPRNEPKSETDFQRLSQLAATYPTDPRGLSRLYRAMTAVPGLGTQRTVDAAGRDVIAVYVTTTDPNRMSIRADLLFDATTYAYSGLRLVALKEIPNTVRNDPSAVPNPFHTGQVVQSEAVIRQALVDHKDQRP